MDDLEMTKLAAEAMGFEIMGLPVNRDDSRIKIYSDNKTKMRTYDPLHDDAQAMALVKKFNLTISGFGLTGESSNLWSVETNLSEGNDICIEGKDLNRAIVECVARMTKAKQSK